MPHATAHPSVGCHSFPRTDKTAPPPFPSPDIFSGMLCLQLGVSLFLFFADLEGIYQRMEVSRQVACQFPQRRVGQNGLLLVRREGGASQAN